MKYKEKVKEVRERLSDFQSATVRYIERRFREGQRRMLVADEVGLGKTWIAKGVIASEYEQWCRHNTSKKTHMNIYYICSSQQLVAQNLKKLNFTEDSKCIVSSVDRISLLSLKTLGEDVPLRIFALTPDTSFNERQGLGTKDERYIVYAILSRYEDFKQCSVGLDDLMEGYWEIQWDTEIYAEYYQSRIRNEVASSFVNRLKKKIITENDAPKCYSIYGLHHEMSLWKLVLNVSRRFHGGSKNVPLAVYTETIGAMRKILTDVCLELMDADIFIMDEFQRYSQLLDCDGEDECTTIAHKVFNPEQKAKVLMLSATPFKSFTNLYDECRGEQHYKDLERVLKFLYTGESMDWNQYENDRARLYSLLMDVGKAKERDAIIKEISEVKQRVEDVYYKVIVRTEKIISSSDPNAMFKNVNDEPLSISSRDIDDFLNLDKVYKSIYERLGEHAPTPVDYAKSAPFAMSFLRDYKVGEKARSKEITLSPNAFINLSQVQKYTFPEGGVWPNAKLNLLMQGMSKFSRMMWCPPSLCYYPLAGPFKGQENFTKTLIFSAWKLVPKMIATLVSYEAERQTLGKMPKEESVKYFVDKRVVGLGDKARRPYRRLVLTSEKNNMSTLLLAYPSRRLAEMTDPLSIVNTGNGVEQLIKEHLPLITKQVETTCEKHGDKNDNTSSHVSWAYPMLMDSQLNNNWIDKVLHDIIDKDKETVLFSKLESLRSFLNREANPSMPQKLNKHSLREQSRQLLLLSLGSPAVCALRALKRYYGDGDNVLVNSFKIGRAFIDMFNKPESIAVLELQYDKTLDYWQKVVRYCVDGNLQAVLDEYVFMLRNDYNTQTEITDAICKVLSMRTATLKIDDAYSFNGNESEDKDLKHSLRTHYAAAFGVKATSSNGSEVRSVNVREAFNSPFRPFLLATTSIGQEGLDFHWYCRRIMHWNLPNNPIDFEQRKGRINRYRGKIIRQRVADKYKEGLNDDERPWEKLFELAKKDKVESKFPCDIIPNWHFDFNDDCIERMVPMYQFSQDIQKFMAMKKILGLYRLTFGQPRQEELIDALNCHLSSEETEKMLIDLCPMKHQCKMENKK